MIRVLTIILLGYVALVLLMWLFQARLLYQPMGRSLVGTPSDIGLEWQDVHLTTSDDVQLHAWWIPATEPRGALLFFHGNAGNISHRSASIEHFNRLGLSVLIVDYRGYGQSEGRPSEQGTALDARAAWQWLTQEQGVAPEKTVLFGRSLGAAVAAELATEVGPAGVILESPFRSVPDLGQRLYPFLPVRWLSRFQYPVIDQVPEIRSPILIIHSRDDEIVPYTEGEAVYNAANEPRQLLTLRGGHNNAFLVSERQYLAHIDAFLAEVFDEGHPQPTASSVTTSLG